MLLSRTLLSSTRGSTSFAKKSRLWRAALTSTHEKGPAVPAPSFNHPLRSYGAGFGSGLRGILSSRIAAW